VGQAWTWLLGTAHIAPRAVHMPFWRWTVRSLHADSDILHHSVGPWLRRVLDLWLDLADHHWCGMTSKLPFAAQQTIFTGSRNQSLGVFLGSTSVKHRCYPSRASFNMSCGVHPLAVNSLDFCVFLLHFKRYFAGYRILRWDCSFRV
jgi:hypothetical protein